MKKLTILALLIPGLCFAEEAPSSKQEPVRILITGSLSPQGMERIGKPISTIQKDEINKNIDSSLGEALSNQPGISGSHFGPGASRPVIRGQGKERVRVIENGLENGDVSASSDDHAVTNDPLSIERVDILRGPSTLMFGGQAIGGLVNIIDNSIAEENIDKELTGNLNIIGGDSANDEFSGSAVLKGNAHNINWYLSAFGRNTNDIEIPGFAESSLLRELEEEEGHDEHDEHEEEHEDHEEEHEHEESEEVRGKLSNSDTESYAFKAGVSHVWDNGFVGVAVRRTDSEYGIPGGHAHHHEEEHHDDEGEEDHDEHEHEEEEEGEENVRLDLEQTRIETRGAVHLHEDWVDSIRFGLALSDYEHKEFEGNTAGTIYNRETVEGRILFTHHHQDILEGGIGLQINYEDFAAIGEEAFIPSTETFHPAVFFVEDFLLSDNLIWQLGGRYEHSSLDPVGLASESFNVYSGSTGLIWHNTQKSYSAAVNLSYSERAPNATELFADGAHVATQTFEVGDSNIKEESSLGAELILRKLTGSTRGSFSAFIQDYSDYINLSEAGSEEDGFAVFNYENVDARFWGFEAEAEQDLIDSNGHLLTLAASFDLVRAKDTDNDENLPRITPVRTRVGLDYSYDIFSGYVNAIFVEDQDRVAEFELPTSSYALLNAGVNFNLVDSADYSLDFFVKGTNLTDEEARVHTSFLKDQVPLRGRAFFAGLNTSF